MKKAKKLLSLLLALCMVAGLLPMAALAETGETVVIRVATADDISTEPAIAEGDIIAVKGTTVTKLDASGGSVAYTSEGEDVTVEVISVALTLSGSVGALQVESTNGVTLATGATVNGTVTLAVGAQVTAAGWTYTAGSAGATMTLGAPNHTVKTGSVSTTAVNNGKWTLGNGASITVDGTAVTAAEDNVDVVWTESSSTMTITGNVGTLSATAGTVNVTGDVGTYSQTVNGSPTINISGSLGDVSTSSGSYESSIAPTVTAKSLTGKISMTGAQHSEVTMKLGADSANPDAWFTVTDEITTESYVTFKDGVLTATLGTNGQKITNLDDTKAIAYSIIMDGLGGTFDTNKQAVTGKVTFKNSVATSATSIDHSALTYKTSSAEDAVSYNLPTITDGKSGAEQPSYGSDNTPFLAEVKFEEGAAGYVDGLMHAQRRADNQQGFVTVGDDAYAAFSYLIVEDDKDSRYDNMAYIGNNASINLTAGRQNSQGKSDAGLYNSGVELAAENNTVANGCEATFLLGENADLADAIITPAGSNIKIKFYSNGDSTDQSLTVGKGAELTVEGASGASKLTIDGDTGITTVMDNATLTLRYVNHNRTGTTNKDIITHDGSKVYLDASVYTGNTSAPGIFDTGSGETGTPGVPGTKTFKFGDVDLPTVTPGQTSTTNIKINEEDYYGYAEPNAGVYAIQAIKPVEGDNPWSGESLQIAEAAFSDEGMLAISTAKGYSAQVKVNGGQAETQSQDISFMSYEPTTIQYLYNLKTTDTVEINVFQTKEGEQDTITLDADETYTNGKDLTIDLKNGNYKANFVVGAGDTMTINLLDDASIAADATFDIGTKGKLVINGLENGTSKVYAPIEIEHNDVTLELNNVTLDYNGDGNDYAALTNEGGNTTLIIKGDVIINGTDGADNEDSIHYNGSATTPQHTQSAGIYNKAGALTIEATKGATLAVNGGDAADASKTLIYYGGAAIANDVNGDLTFTGEGIIKLTGGTGSHGYNGDDGTSTSGNGAENGGPGGPGGFGLYNLNGSSAHGSVTVAMTSETWNEGQLVVTGGNGGKGGTNGKGGESVSTTNGVGGDSGAAIYTGNDEDKTLTVNSGVLLAYTGIVGTAGEYKSSYCHGNHDWNDNCGGEGTCNGHSEDHDRKITTAGTPAPYAITGTSMTVNGGTTYAFGGTNGGSLTGMVVTGGTIFGGVKSSDGFNGGGVTLPDEDASPAKMVPVLGGTGTGFAVTDGVKNAKDETVYFTRIKTGTETNKYLVEGISEITLNDDSTYTYGGAGTGMYVNEQGYLYVYLPDPTPTTFTPNKLTLTLKQSGADVWYQMVCGGASTSSTNDDYQTQYGYGDVHGTVITKSVISYDGNSVWGEAFKFGGKIHYNGIDLALAEKYATLGAAGTPADPTDEDSTFIDTPVELATLAWAVNNYDDFDWAGNTADFAIGDDIDMSLLAWVPIGVDAEHAFQGVIKGLDTTPADYSDVAMRSIQGIRMPTGYADAKLDEDGTGYTGGDAYGLFGYTNGAHISYITVNNGNIAGNAYAQTLETSVYGTNFAVKQVTQDGKLVNVTSGGRYARTAAQMAWDGAVNYMGALVANGTDTVIHNCNAQTLTMTITAPNSDATESDANKDAYAGGLAGKMTGGSISGSKVSGNNHGMVENVSVTADNSGAGNTYNHNAWAGGVVGYMDGGTVSYINLSNQANVGVSVTANGLNACAGGVAGETGGVIIRDFDNGWLDGLTIKAAGKANSYAGGAVGYSTSTTYENVQVTGGDGYITVIEATGSNDGTNNFAGGLMGCSDKDIVKDAQVRAIHANTLTVTTTGSSSGKHYAAGFAAESNGSKFYRSFVRDAIGVASGLGSNKWIVPMIVRATDTQMYGCYAKANFIPGDDLLECGFGTISGTDSKYVGCYVAGTTFQAFASSSSDLSNTFFNCYYEGGSDTPAEDDTIVAVAADKLQATPGEAVAKMNDELMKYEGTDDNTNDSNFDWAEFGAPIMYTADSTNANGGYAVHGEMVKLIVTVSEGADYLAEDWIKVDPTAPTVIGSDGSYWVSKDASVTITLTAAGVTVSSAKYTVNGENEQSTTSTTTLSTATLSITADTVVDFKITPTTYYRYVVDLKDSAASDKGESSGTSQTITLSGSTVVKQSSSNPTQEDSWSDLPNDATIHNVILTATNGSLTLPATPEGWKLVASSSNYAQYAIAREVTDGVIEGADAAEVQDFVQQVRVTFTATSASSPVKGEVNLLVSEWSAREDSLENLFWNGHYYKAETGSVTWAQADSIVRNQRSLLGGMNGSLAVIDSDAENRHVAALNANTGWIAANDATTEGTWVNAIPNGYAYPNTLTYANWHTGEPNDAAGGEDYAAINYLSAGKWNDYSGTQKLGVFFKEYGGVTTKNASGGSDAYTYELTYQSSGGGIPAPDDGKPADPDDTGVSRLLNTDDHIAYVSGYPDGSFRPEQNMTRAEAAQLFFNLLRDQNVTGDARFDDVPEGKWYTKAVLALANLGIIEGKAEGLFDPTAPITRAEFIAMALRFADELTPGTRDFTDVPETHWAYAYVMAATGYGWIDGYADGSFKPGAPITRAEVVTVVNRMLGRAADQAYVDAHLDALLLFPDAGAAHWAYYEIIEAANGHDYEHDEARNESWTGLA